MFLFAITLVPFLGILRFTMRKNQDLTFFQGENRWAFYAGMVVYVPYIIFNVIFVPDLSRFISPVQNVIENIVYNFLTPFIFVLITSLWIPMFGRKRIESNNVSVFLLSFYSVWGIEQYIKNAQSPTLFTFFIWPVIISVYVFILYRVIELILKDRKRFYIYLILFILSCMSLSFLKIYILNLNLLLVLIFGLLSIGFYVLHLPNLNIDTIFKKLPELHIPMKWLGLFFRLFWKGVRFLLRKLWQGIIFAFNFFKKLFSKKAVSHDTKNQDKIDSSD